MTQAGSAAVHVSPDPNDYRVLLLAPFGRDGELAREMLQPAEISVILCDSLKMVCSEANRGCAAIIVTSEALNDRCFDVLVSMLRRQPPWSDLPVVVLVSGSETEDFDIMLKALGNVTVIERPMRIAALSATVHTALRARRRQYQVHELLLQADAARKDAMRQQAFAESQRKHITALNERLQRAMTETHHRVKNNLQIIAALIDMQLLNDTDQIDASEVRRMGQHVRVLAFVHEILTQQARTDGAADFVSVRDVLERLLPLMQFTAVNFTITYELADASVDSRQGTSLALVTNELVSNAVKHGHDRTSVSFQAINDIAILTVCDNGPGFPPDFSPQTAAHTGLDLVLNLVRHDLAGTVSFRTGVGGGEVEIRFPLSKSRPTT